MRWRFVDPERFELSSKHGITYAFYMFIFCLIVGKGKARSVPVSSSVGACSRQIIAPLIQPVLLFDAPVVKLTEQKPDGTKAC
ncbi:MAG: hypothetical protein K0S09_1310 [Sphingobacteriaceae bacterium]|nr:hypothetical protein [Sphingobacteriaceae bacterium]